MIVKNEKPPVWDAACAAFQVHPVNVVFTYGNTLYNPGGKEIGEDVMAHETVHSIQQNYSDADAAVWWGKYLRDPAFRLDQEAKAYGNQYRFLCERIGDRNRRARILWDLGRILCGPLYGRCVTHEEAQALIRRFAMTRRI